MASYDGFADSLVSESVCAPLGFLAVGVSAGIKKSGTKDLALIVSEVACSAAATFTTSEAKAAPVLFDLERIRRGKVRGIVINSGNANACTGDKGLRNAREMSQVASREVAKRGYSCGKEDFLVCSTGRIGVQLPMQRVRSGIKHAAVILAKDDSSAAEAIMTTDTFPKQMGVEMSLAGKRVRIGGVAKGAGMIHPWMTGSGKRSQLHATMLCFLTTDAALSRSVLQQALDEAVAQSFNRISVDGDMSTNDTVLMLANGVAGNRVLDSRSRDFRRFQTALNGVSLALAKMIVQDGEGVSKQVEVEVKGAASAEDAEKSVRAIGNSVLVKCCWCGEDPNWGRIFGAVGQSGAKLMESRFSVAYDGVWLVKAGRLQNQNIDKVNEIVKNQSFRVECNLGLGKGRAILYTTDLTERYVELNKGE